MCTHSRFLFPSLIWFNNQRAKKGLSHPSGKEMSLKILLYLAHEALPRNSHFSTVANLACSMKKMNWAKTLPYS